MLDFSKDPSKLGTYTVKIVIENRLSIDIIKVIY